MRSEPNYNAAMQIVLAVLAGGGAAVAAFCSGSGHPVGFAFAITVCVGALVLIAKGPR